MDADRKRILVVESDQLVAAVVAEMLEDAGFRASVAHDGPAARTAWGGGNLPVDVVVLAVVVRGESGASLADHVRDLGLPLVMVSGSDQVMIMAADQGLQLLHKPFGAHALIREVNAALSSGIAGWRSVPKSAAGADAAADRQQGSTRPSPGVAEQDESPEKARQWRMKAEELRTVGDQMKDPRAQESYRRMAASHEVLPDRLEGKAGPDGESEAG